MMDCSSISFRLSLWFSEVMESFFTRVLQNKVFIVAYFQFFCILLFYVDVFLPLYLLTSYTMEVIDFLKLILYTISLNFACSNCSWIRFWAMINIFYHTGKLFMHFYFKWYLLNQDQSWILTNFHFSICGDIYFLPSYKYDDISKQSSVLFL